MSILLNDNLSIQAPKATDSRYGPFADTATALTSVILANRYQGLTVGIGSGTIIEYWFRDGTADANLILKVDNTANTGSANTIFLQGALNTANANTIYTQGVDATQNTWISSNSLYSQAAFAQANLTAGGLVMANANTIYLQGALNTANANTVFLTGVNTTQNSWISSNAAYTQSAFNTANVGNTFVNTGGTVNGSITIVGGLNVSGNINVAGSLVTYSSNSISVQDPIIYLASNNSANVVDIGMAGRFVGGQYNNYQHTGVIRNHLTGNWVFFSNVSSEPSATINFAEANLVYDSITAGGFNVNGRELYAYSSYLQGGLNTANANTVFIQSGLNTANANTVYLSGALATANANTVFLTGVNLTQNAWISANQVYSQAAFAQANLTAGGLVTANANTIYTQGVDLSQNNSIALLQGGLNTSNANIAYIFGIDVSQNNSIALLQGGLNTANANTIYIKGVDDTQNTWISSNSLYSQAAFAQANLTAGGLVTANSNITFTQGVDVTQNSWISSNASYFQGITNSQNTSISVIQGVDATQNTQISGIQGVDVGQNAAITIIQGVDATQNTQISIIQGVDATQNTWISSNVTYIAGVDLAQNSAITIIQGVDVTQNTNIQTAWNTANNALPNIGSVITVNSVSQLIVSNTTPSTSNTTGALVVSGGVGIGGGLYVNSVTSASTSPLTLQAFGGSAQPVNIYGGNNGSSGAGGPININAGYGGAFGGNGGSITLKGGAGYSGYQGGSIILAGGIGAANGAVITSNTSQLLVQSTAPSTSTTTGALVVAGGLGVAGNITTTGIISSNIVTNNLGTTPSLNLMQVSSYSQFNTIQSLSVTDPSSGRVDSFNFSVGAANARGGQITFGEFGGTGGFNSIQETITCYLNEFRFAQAGNNPITFYTNGSERVRIDGSGNVGIGTVSPTSNLHVIGTANVSSNMIVGGTTTLTGTVTTAGDVVAGSGSFYISSAGNGYAYLNSGGTLAWTSGGTANSGTRDLALVRDAANILAQRNSTNAQTFRLYNTYTDSANNEYLSVDWTTTANIASINTKATGNGTVRALSLNNFANGAVYTGNLYVNNNVQAYAVGSLNGLASNFRIGAYSGYSITFGAGTAGTEFGRFDPTGNFLIGTTTSPSGNNGIVVTGNVTISATTVSSNTTTGALVVNGGVGINGALNATTKSFVINHPTKPGMSLRYGSLESPYHGVRLTGQDLVVNGICVVKLPDYIYKLVKSENVNIQITNIKHGKVLWVDNVDVENNQFTVKTKQGFFDKTDYEFYWTFTATRKDVDDLQVEG